MELKAKLKYTTEQQRIDFIIQYNRKLGYEIRENNKVIEAWGDTPEETLTAAKEGKLTEALNKAYEYENKTGFITFDGRPVPVILSDNEESGDITQESGDSSAQPQNDETMKLSVELFNQSKFFQMVIGFAQGLLTDDFIYSTKEDVVVFINEQEAQAIYYAITEALSKLWTVQYPMYKKLIAEASTLAEVDEIVIDYAGVE